MNYIVLDLEWNQSVNPKKMVKKPIRLYGEIIQIGAVKLDENYHILGTFKAMVAPKYYREMHRKVTELTKITTEDLQRGIEFPIAIESFKSWCGDEFVFLTWGPSDVEILYDNMTLHELDADWIPHTYDIQTIFDDQITHENRQVSLSQAMEMVGEPALTAHDALHDARNTVCVCLHLDMLKGMTEYAEIKKRMPPEPKEPKKKASKPIKIYPSKRKAFSDPELVQFQCPKCGCQVTCSEFVGQDTVRRISIANCDNGDELFVRFKIKPYEDGTISVKRTIYELNDDRRKLYNKKRRAEKKKKYWYAAKNKST